MMHDFEQRLQGKDWWKLFTVYWIIMIVINKIRSHIEESVGFLAYAWFLAIYSGEALKESVPSIILIPFSVSLIFLILFLITFVVKSVYGIKWLRIAVPKLSVGGRSFKFECMVGEYLKIFFSGILLSIITLGVYTPWFCQRATAYLVSKTSFDGERVNFQGTATRLFFILLTGVLIVSIILFFWLNIVTRGEASFKNDSLIVFPLFVSIYIVFSLFVPFIYSWLVDFRWKDTYIYWESRFRDDFTKVLGQVVLTVITMGIYGPATFLKLYRYFAGRTVLIRDDVEQGRLSFNGEVGEGFGLIWVQMLLTIVTLGFYTPWAVSKIGRWLSESTFVNMSSPKIG